MGCSSATFVFYVFFSGAGKCKPLSGSCFPKCFVIPDTLLQFGPCFFFCILLTATAPHVFLFFVDARVGCLSFSVVVGPSLFFFCGRCCNACMHTPGRRCFCLQNMQIRSNRTPHPTPCVYFLALSFFCVFCPRRTVVFTFSGRASFVLCSFSARHSGPCAFLGCWDFLGLEFDRPFWGLLSDAMRQGCLRRFSFLARSPSVVFAASHVSLAGRPTARPVPGRGVSTSRPSPQWPRERLECGGLMTVGPLLSRSIACC